MNKSEEGSIAVEAAIVLPVVLLFCVVLFEVILSAQTTSSAAQAAANETARAASQQQTYDGAYRAANRVLIKSHNNNEISCGSLTVSGDFTPGGFVETSVTCTSSDGILSKKNVETKSAVEIIDLLRSSR